MDLIPPPGGYILWCVPFPYVYVVRLTVNQHQRESGKAFLEANVNVRISMRIPFPTWMCCGSSTGDGIH